MLKFLPIADGFDAQYLATRTGETEETKLKEAKADGKQSAKNSRFALARLEWYIALQDLAIFRETELLSVLTQFAVKSRSTELPFIQELDELSRNLSPFAELQVEDSRHSIEARRAALENRRRAAEIQCAMERPDVRAAQAHVQERGEEGTSMGDVAAAVMWHNKGRPQSPEPAEPANARLQKLRAGFQALRGGDAAGASRNHLSASASLPTLQFTGNGHRERTVSQQSITATRKKEGFLWATTKPGTFQSNSDG